MMIRNKFLELANGSQIKLAYEYHDVHLVKLDEFEQCAVIINSKICSNDESKLFQGFEIYADLSGSRVIFKMSKSDSNLTIFSSLIEFVLERLASQKAINFQILVDLANEWREFGRIQSSVISLNMQIGLFGELLFLARMLPLIGSSAIIKAWNGPDKCKVDFVFSSKLAVEIKSSADPLQNQVTISSIEQLASGFNSHFLRRYGIAETPTGINLKDLFFSIKETIFNYALRDEFRIKVTEGGFNPYVEYDNLKLFSLVTMLDYDVSIEDFPKIVPPLNNRIVGLSYTINLDGVNSLEQNQLDEIIKSELQ